MTRSALMLAALAALWMAAGVWIGHDLGSDKAAVVRVPEALHADAALPPAPEPPPLLGARSDEQVAARLARLEEAVAALRAEQAKLQKAVEPGAEVLAFFKSRIPEFGKDADRGAAANRTAAIATLRNVTSAQAQVQASGRVDTDADGTGEYGGFLEMSGAVPGRMARALNPPVLSSAFKTLNASGEAQRSGYLFRFYLPGPRGEGIGEPAEGFGPGSGVDADLAETTWCCYAWPVDAKASGPQVFFMNQAGDVLTTEDVAYSGEGNGPAPDAAFLQPGSITGAVAIGRAGADGNVWKQAR